MCVCVCVYVFGFVFFVHINKRISTKKCLCNLRMCGQFCCLVLFLSGWLGLKGSRLQKTGGGGGHNNLSGVNGFHSVIIYLVQSKLSKVFAWLQLPQRSSCASVTPAPAAQHAALCPLSPRPPLRHPPPHSPSPVWVLIPQVCVFCFKCKSGSPVVHK